MSDAAPSPGPSPDRRDTAPQRERRWRLVLGEDAAPDLEPPLSGLDLHLDQTLASLYGGGDGEDDDGQPAQGGGGGGGGAARQSRSRKGSLGSGRSPNVARWLEDVRKQFPSSVVRVMQQDAIDRLGLKQLLLEKEMLEAVVPDVQLCATLVGLSALIPPESKASARAVVQRVVDQLLERLAAQTQQAIMGALSRSVRSRRPRLAEIDWPRTLRANLRHWQEEEKTLIPETRIGFGRKRKSLKDLILCLDVSGSMAPSVVYASVFAAVLASLPALSMTLVSFDTEVVDLSHLLEDPVDVLFGVQLGGGTDITKAMAFCQQRVTRPNDTLVVLISDLFDGGDWKRTAALCGEMARSGVQVIALLALDDSGAPAFSHESAADLAALGIPAFACTPDKFPALMAAAMNRQDLFQWAAAEEIVTARADEPQSSPAGA